MKKIVLLILFFTVQILFGQPVEESQIPAADVEYELPEIIIGEFILISSACEYNITIFPNNKYIYTYKAYEHYYTNWSYGHIVNINNRWYTSPLSHELNTAFGYYFSKEESSEIHLTDYGFSLFNMQAIRKEDIPVPINLAEDISLSSRLVRNQYFEINNSRIDFNKIVRPRYEPYSHSLIIDNGIVNITCGVTIGELLKTSQPELAELYQGFEDHFFSISTQFTGFIDLIEENDNGFKGIIIFTNGVPYYYIEDGTAQIEKINDDIIITMLYTPDLRLINLGVIKIPDEYQFPVTLILEF